MKLDRTSHRAYNFKNQIAEGANYKGFSLSELAEVFNYLQSVAYDFKLNNYPKMDKKRIHVEKMGNVFNQDFQEFLVALNTSNVKYVLVGGYSVIYHGFPRTTGDLDIFVEVSKPNYICITKAKVLV